jgi:hypothetical protein
MKTQLSINLTMDEIFRKCATELNLTFVCVQEEMDSNRYEIVYNFPHDLYYLGIKMGMDKTQEIFTK